MTAFIVTMRLAALICGITVDQLRNSGRATITPAETFDLIDIGKNSGWRGLHSGEIPGLLRVGRKYLVSTAALLRWLDGGTSPPEHEATPTPLGEASGVESSQAAETA